MHDNLLLFQSGVKGILLSYVPGEATHAAPTCAKGNAYLMECMHLHGRPAVTQTHAI
jgi:hypothetical protein